MNQLAIVNPLYLPEWDEWVLSTSSYSIFHSQAWARVLVESYGYTPCYLVLYDNGHPAAAWPVMQTNSFWSGKKGVSLPFSDHCEPIVSDDKYHRELFDGLRQHALQLKWKSIEVRGGSHYIDQFSKAASVYNWHVLYLDSNEKVMTNRLRSSTRRNIKKAIKSKVEISVNSSLESIRDFYHLNCLTRKHHGLPPQPFSFFKNVYLHIISQNSGIVVLARYQNRVIAGAVYFHFGNRAMYKYGASDRNYLKFRPNDLVMWEAIKWYASRDYKQFDLGRSELKNTGLNRFKNGWSATAIEIYYYLYLLSKQNFVENKKNFPSFVTHAFKFTPLFFLRIIGTLAYKHIA